MSWVSNYKYKWYENLALNIIRCGYLPRHIAFIMDGNRRFAKSEHIAKIDGHSKGFDKLADCLRWCLDIGIREVTTFAFSIENFKRTEDEINGLFNLAKEKLCKLLIDKDKLKEHGVRISFIGNIALLPSELQQVIAQAILCTEENNKLFLNIAFSYTSHDEITQAVESTLNLGTDVLNVTDINEKLFAQCMYTRKSTPPDLLFRTSGENRVSDFLTWQISASVLYFTQILWPQITIWNFLRGIFAYQRAAFPLESFKVRKEKEISSIENIIYVTHRIQEFQHRLRIDRRKYLLKFSEIE